MSTSKKLFVNDCGHTFRVYAKMDLSSATSIIFKVKKPDGSVVNWNAMLAVDNNYYAVYSTVEGDLNIAGEYLIAIYVVIPGSPDNSVFTGSTDRFSVYNIFEDDCTIRPNYK